MHVSGTWMVHTCRSHQHVASITVFSKSLIKYECCRFRQSIDKWGNAKDIGRTHDNLKKQMHKSQTQLATYFLDEYLEHTK